MYLSGARAFRRSTMPIEEASVKYGLDDAEEMGNASFAGLVLVPFQRTTPEPRERNVSAEATL